MSPWTSESNPAKQLLMAALCTAAGAALMIALRNYGGTGSNAFAGFLLGVLLLVIGVAGLLVSGKQTVVVDPQSRCIVVVDSGRFGTKTRSIPFEDVEDISIGFLGKRSNYVMQYYLVLKLKSGENYPLFAPGRGFAGSSDRAVVAGWQRRLEEYLKAPASIS